MQAAGTFQTTHWSLVLTAGSDSSEAREALNQLCHSYWRPLFIYLRRAGHSKQDAEDLTQQFLAELLAHDGLARVHPRHGRFRSFLLASLRNFLSHQRERAAAQKRGGGRRLVSMEGDDCASWQELATGESPEIAFDRNWGLTVLQRTRERLEAEYIAAGKKFRFAKLEDYLPGGEPKYSQAELAEILGTTVSAIKSEVFRLRQRYGQYLRAEITTTVASPAEIDDEIRHLLRLFSHTQSRAPSAR